MRHLINFEKINKEIIMALFASLQLIDIFKLFSSSAMIIINQFGHFISQNKEKEPKCEFRSVFHNLFGLVTRRIV